MMRGALVCFILCYNPSTQHSPSQTHHRCPVLVEGMNKPMMRLFRVNQISNQYQIILTCSLPGPGWRVSVPSHPTGASLPVPCLPLGCPSSSQQVKTLQKRRVQDLAQPHHLPLGPSREGGPLWQTQTRLAALSLSLLTYKVGTARPPRGTLPRSTEIPHLRTHIAGLRKGSFPSFIMQCSTTCTYYVEGGHEERGDTQ